MIIKILGSGCKNCAALTENTREALKSLNIDAEIVKITDYAEMAAFGVMSTPALVIDDKVVSAGKVLKAKEIAQIIEKAKLTD